MDSTNDPISPTSAGSPLPRAELGRAGRFGILGVALSILVLEIGLTRVFSAVMWYHFAFVAISLAMLGLAVAGIALYLAPRLVRRADAVMPAACMLAALSTVAALVYLVRVPVRTDLSSGLLNGDIAVLYLVTFFPFLFGGLAISAAFARFAHQITTLYLYDLVGAAFGCVLVVVMLNLWGAPAAVLGAALLFAVSGMLLRPRGSSSFGRLAQGATVAGLVGLMAWQVSAHPLEPVFVKGRTDKEAQGSPAVFQRWNSHSLIRVYDVTDSPGVREIVIDGGASTACFQGHKHASPEMAREEYLFLCSCVGGAPYGAIPYKPEVLIIGPGGGREILIGLAHDAHVTAIELNGVIYELMTTGLLADWTGNLYRGEGVTTVHDEARSWLRRTDRHFDLIQATLVDTWAATASGAFALAENALYTVEAFNDYFERLTDGGVVHFTRWYLEPPRESVRTVVLMWEVLRRRGVPNPENHFVVFRDPEGGRPCTSILWSRTPFTPERVAKLFDTFDKTLKLVGDSLPEVLYAPGRPVTEDIGKFLTSNDKDRFIREYPYDIRPTTEDRPFFFNTVRLTDVLTLNREIMENEQASIVLVTILAIVAGIVAVAFGLPFVVRYSAIRREDGRGTPARLLYFCALGVGFMLVEIPALQRFGLYLGHPTYALTTILASFLLGTGIGSAIAGKYFGSRPVAGARVGLGLVILGVGALIVVLPTVLTATLHAPIGLRIVITILLLAPLGVCMGFPFPLGVRALEPARARLVPWAWGLNGATSVLASVLGVAVGMHFGFSIAALTGAAAYAVAFLTARRLAVPVAA